MYLQHRGPKLAALALFGAVTVALFLYWFMQAGGHPVPRERYTVKAVLPNAVKLVTNADVRQEGVKIGRVSGVEDHPSGVAVELELDDEYAPIYRDARFLVRTRTLLGESYLDVEPGIPSAGAVASGQTLPVDRAQESVELDEILSALDKPTRDAVRSNLRGFGRGLGGHGEALNELLGQTQPAVANGGRVARALRVERKALAHVVDDTGDLMQAVGDRGQEVELLARQLRTTATAVANRDVQVAQTIGELQPLLSQVRRSAGGLGRLGTVATPVVRDLRRTLVHARPLLRDLEPAAREGRALLAQIPPLVRVADPALRRVPPFTRAATPTVAVVDELLRHLNPVARYVRPYAPDLGSMLAGLGTGNDFRDSIGNLARIFPAAWQGSFTAVPTEHRKLLEELLTVTGANRSFGEQRNAYPEPGTLAARKPLTKVPEPPPADK